MCLAIVTSFRRRRWRRGIGYVVVRWGREPEKYEAMWRRTQLAAKIGEWRDAWATYQPRMAWWGGLKPALIPILDTRLVPQLPEQAGKSYPSGWHILQSVEDARMYAKQYGMVPEVGGIVEVEWRYQVCRGIEPLNVYGKWTFGMGWTEMRVLQMPTVIARYRRILRKV